MSSKFGLQIYFELLKRVTPLNAKPEVDLRRHDRYLENRYDVITPPGVFRFG